VNYYPPGSTMGGHLDDAELIKSKPIVSISLGQTAIFLLGGPTKATEPVAIKVRSGDVIIMGGASRCCYHGVPRIITDSFQASHVLASLTDSEKTQQFGCSVSGCSMQAVLDYLSSNRLNVNVRQVQGDAPDEQFGSTVGPAVRGAGMAACSDEMSTQSI